MATTEKPAGPTYRPQSELEWAGLRHLVATESIKRYGRSALVTSEESPFEAILLEVLKRRLDSPGKELLVYNPGSSLKGGRLAFRLT